MRRIWILGAADPEMERIEAVLCDTGERVAYATRDGERVTPAQAYDAPDITLGGVVVWGLDSEAICVECAPWPTHGGPHDGIDWSGPVTVVDHHRPGDPGYGLPPERYAEAASLGQVLRRLGLPAGPHDRMVMAADHCLGAAYRGACPGVDPEDLRAWRIASRSTFQRRSPGDLRRDVERAERALRAAPLLELAPGVAVRDMRGPVIAELPEAAAYLGEAYTAGPLRGPDGPKYTVSGPPDTVSAWMVWATAQGLRRVYGDPQRGFAGGYARSG